ncbi:hypothetical protein BDP55DRAFT_279576 [Colletotrichum godetiae]|uniref:Uncharacterized protein n=1 Tax=Colletotrichum godetiae TaxID=1209918 RepID=A0AAJ0AGP9_9PEZI|nr:uncharacterized protein BDP55DRAFT_279576 [Colletotrichum godetiae]KAK1672118.1 hypothetical protein BDP55DRAFT_279576 [Colletotrichum godetiae]
MSLDLRLEDTIPDLTSSVGFGQADEEMERMTGRYQVADPAIQRRAFFKLSKTNVDLHYSLSSNHIHKPHLSRCPFAPPSSTRSVGSLTAPELTLIAFQDFSCSSILSYQEDVSQAPGTLPAQRALSWDSSCSKFGTLDPLLLVRGRASSALGSHTTVLVTTVRYQPVALTIVSYYLQPIAVFEKIFVYIHQKKKIESIA